MTYNIKPEMESRNIFNYKCHTCKETKEPNEFGYNNQTKTKRVTCNVCHLRRSERAKALKESRALAQAATQHIMGDTATEEEETRIVAYIPLATSEEEPVCENACFNRQVCNAVRARFTCGHLQCIQTHLAIGYCIACGCSTLRYDHVIILGNGSSSSSGPAIPEADRQPEEEPEPETEDPLSYFVTEHP